jgi:hypothetical protein
MHLLRHYPVDFAVVVVHISGESGESWHHNCMIDATGGNARSAGV